MAETFVERTGGDSTPTLRLIGSAAYEHACYLIETNLDACDENFWDPTTCDAVKKEDVDAAVRYLSLRGLIARNGELIAILDESEEAN